MRDRKRWTSPRPCRAAREIQDRVQERPTAPAREYEGRAHQCFARIEPPGFVAGGRGQAWGILKMARRPRGESPHYVDLHVGGRIRERRKALRLSLEALAAALGITHQQMQKYETGGNRITVSTLYEIAGALGVWVGDLYEGLPAPGDVTRLDRTARDHVERLLANPDGLELLAAFIVLPPHMQQPLVAMARASAAPGRRQAGSAEPDRI